MWLKFGSAGSRGATLGQATQVRVKSTFAQVGFNSELESIPDQVEIRTCAVIVYYVTCSVEQHNILWVRGQTYDA